MPYWGIITLASQGKLCPRRLTCTCTAATHKCTSAKRRPPAGTAIPSVVARTLQPKGATRNMVRTQCPV
jgi:hypothetical protein